MLLSLLRIPSHFHHPYRPRRWGFYILFDPHIPTFYLISFHIPKFNVVSKFDGTHLDVQAVTSIEVKNPNHKLDIYCSKGFDISMSIGDKNDAGLRLGTKEVKGFTQQHRNNTNMKVEGGVRNKVVEHPVGKKLLGQFKSNEVKVMLEGKTRVGYVIQGWRAGMMQINVLCAGVRLKSIDAGDMPRCTINAFKWINIC